MSECVLEIVKLFYVFRLSFVRPTVCFPLMIFLIGIFRVSLNRHDYLSFGYVSYRFLCFVHCFALEIREVKWVPILDELVECEYFFRSRINQNTALTCLKLKSLRKSRVVFAGRETNFRPISYRSCSMLFFFNLGDDKKYRGSATSMFCHWSATLLVVATIIFKHAFLPMHWFLTR